VPNSSMMYSNMKTAQCPDTSKMVDDLFVKLDTKGQGYLEKSDLQTAFSKVSQSDRSSSSNGGPTRNRKARPVLTAVLVIHRLLMHQTPMRSS